MTLPLAEREAADVGETIPPRDRPIAAAGVHVSVLGAGLFRRWPPSTLDELVTLLGEERYSLWLREGYGVCRSSADSRGGGGS